MAMEEGKLLDKLPPRFRQQIEDAEVQAEQTRRHYQGLRLRRIAPPNP